MSQTHTSAKPQAKPSRGKNAVPSISGEFQVIANLIINADIKDTWKVLEDFYDVHLWAPGVSKSHAINDLPLGVGAGRYCKLDDFGAIEEHITHWQPGTGFIYKITPLGPLDNAVSSWQLTSMADSQTLLEVVLKYDIRFGLFGTFMHKLMMRNKLEKALPETLQAVKKRVELLA